MSSPAQNQYKPDFVSPPGETLLETLEALGMSQAQLAERTGRSKKMINEIIKGKAPITPKMAIELERVVGVPASFWNNRERHYREWLAGSEEQERLKEKVVWLDKLPVPAMVKQGWIGKYKDKIEQLQEVLKFFGIASPEQWQSLDQVYLGEVAFRRTRAFESDLGALISWLRKGELDAKNIHCEVYNARKFRNALTEIRLLTVEPPEVFQPALVELCGACGVAVVLVPELPKTRISGATRWITSEKALIREVFIEGPQVGTGDKKEEQANEFASEFLIPQKELSRFLKLDRFSIAAIQAFASYIKIAPGIVVGRLQYDSYLPVTHCNRLKRRFDWT